MNDNVLTRIENKMFKRHIQSYYIRRFVDIYFCLHVFVNSEIQGSSVLIIPFDICTGLKCIFYKTFINSSYTPIFEGTYYGFATSVRLPFCSFRLCRPNRKLQDLTTWNTYSAWSEKDAYFFQGQSSKANVPSSHYRETL